LKKLVINGGYPLKGAVKISGAKNAALPMMTASILSDHDITLHNVPELADVRTMMTLLESMGMRINKNHDDSLKLNGAQIESKFASYDLVKTMRASIMVLGPLLAKYGEAKVSLPGGCAIGARPVDLHIQGLEKLGANIEIKDGYILASAERLKGSMYHFPIKSVTGTANILMAATLAEGETKIHNAACEPEITHLGELLNSMGAKIKGLGKECITVEGVENLGGAEIKIIPDRIEAITMIIAGIITRGELTIQNINPLHMRQPIELIRQSGARLEIFEDSLFVDGSNEILPIDFETQPYPAIPTDIQAQLMVLNAIAEGDSKVTETIFENRFMHVLELKRMGANIRIAGNTAEVRGVSRLNSAPVMATDLRASAALILAGLIADGETIIDRIYHLDRGYENLEEKLSNIGAKVQRID
jgi:UDP-N-acetylglucosamine 1-carboxyvinyltransferase|tara:strand:- start:12685 stop:13938 length:1254 start_codon:yes stop_codon:yes gene_type:complete